MWGRRSGLTIRDNLGKFGSIWVRLVGFHSDRIKKLGINWGQMVTKEFGHTKSANFFSSENLCHFLVRGEILFVFRILQIVLFEVSPKLFDAFSTTGLKKKKIRIKYLDLIFFNQLGSF